MAMEIRPVRSITSSTAINPIASEGHKIEKNARLAHLTVQRRQEASSHEHKRQEVLEKDKRNKDSVDDAAKNLNKLMGLIDKEIKFAVHEDTKRIMVKVINSDSGAVLSEFPSEKMLDLYASLVEAIGIVVDEKI